MANGKVPNADQRAKRLAKEIDETENTLATAIGQQVAAHLGQLLQPIVQMLPQLATVAAGQKTACLYCAARRKLATVAANQALAAQQAEYDVMCKAAAELGDTPPEFTPVLPELPGVQEACTWVPVIAAEGYPPTAVPVCFDDLPTEPAGPAKQPFRPTGLVTPDGRQIIAPNE